MIFRISSSSKNVSSPPPSPSSPKQMVVLKIPDVANIFVKMHRSSNRAKTQFINGSSGEEPQTHAGILEAIQCPGRESLEQADVFYCLGGVNLPMLLRTTRASLLEIALDLGANVLVDEQWTSSIHIPKNRQNGTFKVTIKYNASATLSECRDPQRPVALEQATGIPGLMTVIGRDE